MIQWSLTLTGNQIALLRAYRDRQFGKPYDVDRDTRGDDRGYIAGTRVLCREGLMEYRHTLQLPDKLGRRYTDGTKSGVFLTDRGRFILQMIEQDIAKFLAPAAVRKSRKREKVSA